MNRPRSIATLAPKLFVLIAIFCAQTSLAQAPDSITHRYDSIAKIKLSQIDSSQDRFNNKIDSAQGRINNLFNPNLSRLTSRFRTRKLMPTDTIRATHELDSLKRGLNTKIDSLNRLNLPTDRYTGKLDSLNQIGPRKYIEMSNAKLEAIENKGNKPITDLENKINEKMDVLRKEGGENANLPGNINTKDIGVGNVNVPGNDLKLNKDLGLNGKIENPIGDQTGKVGELKDNIAELKSAPQEQLDKVKSIDQVQSAQEKLGDANQVTDKLQSYQGDVKNISQGNLNEVKDIPEAIENKATQVDELKDLGKQTAEIDKAKGMIDKGKDPEALKEMGKTEIKKQAIDHFKGQEEALKTAMDKMSKLKQKYSEVTSLKDLPKRPPNPMKNKPLIERIVPGLTLQVQKSAHVMIDFNPVVSYRFSGRINAGFGWNERFAFVKWNSLSHDERIYGPRVFGSFAFKKGFAAKAEVEKMNALIPSSSSGSDGSRQWVWSAFVGLKKDYKFIGKVNGNVQVLYNLYDDHYNSPYVERLNVRMGFEFPMKKAKKSLKKAGK